MDSIRIRIENKLGLDLHWNKKLDQDPFKTNVDPKPGWFWSPYILSYLVTYASRMEEIGEDYMAAASMSVTFVANLRETATIFGDT